MNTPHPWFHLYPVDADAEYLIIGTHPPMPYCGRLQFYYGNTGEFWRILDRVYPGEKLFDRTCPELTDAKTFLAKHKIWITDMVEATNGDPFSTDNQMQGIVLNKSLKKQLTGSKIHTIYFTSFGGKNSALNLFKRWLKENGYKNTKIPDCKIWREEGLTIQLQARSYKLHLLFSPSPTANRSAWRITPYQAWKAKQKNVETNSYFDFRVWWYKNRMPK
jgi:G:T/U-mismatch repair DNA glycosylase